MDGSKLCDGSGGCSITPEELAALGLAKYDVVFRLNGQVLRWEFFAESDDDAREYLRTRKDLEGARILSLVRWRG